MAADRSSLWRSTDEVRRLRAHVRDLFALLALPLLWREREPADICSSLVETLRSLLRVDFAWVRVERGEDNSTLEAAYRAEDPALAADFDAAVAAWKASSATASGIPAPPPRSGGAVRTSAAVAELEGERVLVLVGASRGEFPTQIDSVLLRAATDQAMLSMRAARLNAERAQLLAREKAARAEAETANRLKDEFLASMSHELRTPLQAMLGWITLLRDGGLSDEVRERGLATIERNARGQAQIVDDLLDVSRIINGKLTLQLVPVDVGGVVEGAVESIRPSADAKGVRLELSIERTDAVLADPGRLQQIALNLLSNAVKFTPPGGRVHVAVDRRESAVVLQVADTGSGISAAFLPHVFERFRQFDGSRTRSYGGLGLGLAIVRHLVELHRGTIEAQSDGADRGATFTVRLPVTARPCAPSPLSVDDAGAALAFAPELAGLHVLALEDDEDAGEALRRLLQSGRMRVTVAAKGAEAIGALVRERPDLIVSDLGMQDGFAFIAQVRALPAEQGGCTPAIALTAPASAEERTRILRAGYSSHVPKPIEGAELIATLAAVWDGRSRR